MRLIEFSRPVWYGWSGLHCDVYNVLGQSFWQRNSLFIPPVGEVSEFQRPAISLIFRPWVLVRADRRSPALARETGLGLADEIRVILLLALRALGPPGICQNLSVIVEFFD